MTDFEKRVVEATGASTVDEAMEKVEKALRILNGTDKIRIYSRDGAAHIAGPFSFEVEWHENVINKDGEHYHAQESHIFGDNFKGFEVRQEAVMQDGSRIPVDNNFFPISE